MIHALFFFIGVAIASVSKHCRLPRWGELASTSATLLLSGEPSEPLIRRQLAGRRMRNFPRPAVRREVRGISKRSRSPVIRSGVESALISL